MPFVHAALHSNLGRTISSSLPQAIAAIMANFDVEFLQGAHGIHFLEIDSTQDYALREVASFPPEKLSIVSADFQTHGRGQGDRKWESGRSKNILATYVFCIPAHVPQTVLPNLTLVLAHAAVKTLRGATSDHRDFFNFEVKWPNDILCNGKKMGGILAQSVNAKGGATHVCAGIGLNINKTREEVSSIDRRMWPATSLKVELEAHGGAAATYAFDVASIRDALSVNFYYDLKRLFSEGFGLTFHPALERLMHLKGKRVSVNQKTRAEGPGDDASVYCGTFEGLDESCHMIQRLDDGNVKTWVSGEIVPLVE